ncbi:hypothetical protein BY458DRAFT_584240, partial [Sporodiniella umbellata]
MFSGGMANVLVGVLNFHPDVVKTRMQDEGKLYKITWSCIRMMHKQEELKSRIVTSCHSYCSRRSYSVCYLRTPFDFIEHLSLLVK